MIRYNKYIIMRNDFPRLQKKQLDLCHNPKNLYQKKIKMKDCSHCKRQVPKLYHKCSPNEPNFQNQKWPFNPNNCLDDYYYSYFFGNGTSYFEQDPYNPLHFVQYIKNDIPNNFENLNYYDSNENEFYYELTKFYDCYCEFDEQEKAKRKKKKKKKKIPKKNKKSKKDEIIQSEKNEKVSEEEKFLKEFKQRLLKRELTLYKI